MNSREREDGIQLITVNRLNGQAILINPHLIETIEATPDTVITLTTGKKYVVSDSVKNVIQEIIQYRQQIQCFFEKHGDE